MSELLRKIEELEAEMAKTQKNNRNKASSPHFLLLQAKVAKLRRVLNLPKSQGGFAKEESFEVTKT